MLSMKLIGDTPEELKKARALYYRAFPKNERRSFPEPVENHFGGIWWLLGGFARTGRKTQRLRKWRRR